MMTETCRLLCIVVYVLTLQLISGSTAASTPPPQVGNSSSSCNTTCGRVSIPFPFGIGRKECYLNSWFEVVCKTINTSGSSVTTVPFLSRLNREVVNISFPMNQKISDGLYGVVHIKGPVTSLGCTTSQVSGNSSQVLNVTGRESPYFITDDNRLVAVGRGTKASLTDIECCQARIPLERPQVIGFSMENSNGTSGGGCRVAFLSNSMYSPANVREPEQFHSDGYAVVQLGWFSVFDASDSRSSNFWGCFKSTTAQSYMTNTSCFCYNGDFSGMSYTNCYCASGYIGNPYIQSGCTDDDACKSPDICGEGETCENAPGLGYRCNPKPKIIKPDKTPVLQGILIGLLGLLFIVGTFGLYKFVKKRRKIIRNKKFFKRNGGLLLNQQLTTKDGNVEMSKIFSSKELKKATDNFSENRVLGQGGQGTVYKGMLVDGRIVAVKRSKVVDEDRLEEFINEVVLLSQINHRNIVKLLGCCLETEVPVLVYEYIPNGDLFKLGVSNGLSGWIWVCLDGLIFFGHFWPKPK
ncbi:hypothetical protein DY000_02045502 [Brassica cretica]|uniref:Protein kinase domain-containing protein n=1 Tax=Brassica cretica TaxID=69181 RepID=A0ABQ7ETP1_BRACR|nr:hypothetical protein DY000_02045502 [Brassica cretica]